MFKIMLEKDGMRINMPHDHGLRLLEAAERADIYKRHNPSAVFTVVNEENDNIEYQI